MNKIEVAVGLLILCAITGATIWWLAHDLKNIPAWGALGALIQVGAHLAGG